MTVPGRTHGSSWTPGNQLVSLELALHACGMSKSANSRCKRQRGSEVLLVEDEPIEAGPRVLDAAAFERPAIRRAILTGSRDERVMWRAAQRDRRIPPPSRSIRRCFSRWRCLRASRPPRLLAFVAAQCERWASSEDKRGSSRSRSNRSRVEMARDLAIEEATVATHVRRVLRRTDSRVCARCACP